MIIVAAAVAHPANWFAGWSLILAGFLAGAVIGLGFHRDEYLGGDSSFRRRMVRLGHIALAALGIINLAFALSPWPVPGRAVAQAASICFIAGGAFNSGLLARRVWDPDLRVYATGADIFNLLFFLATCGLLLAGYAIERPAVGAFVWALARFDTSLALPGIFTAGHFSPDLRGSVIFTFIAENAAVSQDTR